MIWCWLIGHHWFLWPERNIYGDHVAVCQRCLKVKTPET